MSKSQKGADDNHNRIVKLAEELFVGERAVARIDLDRTNAERANAEANKTQQLMRLIELAHELSDTEPSEQLYKTLDAALSKTAVVVTPTVLRSMIEARNAVVHGGTYGESFVLAYLALELVGKVRDLEGKLSALVPADESDLEPHRLTEDDLKAALETGFREGVRAGAKDALEPLRAFFGDFAKTMRLASETAARLEERQAHA